MTPELTTIATVVGAAAAVVSVGIGLRRYYRSGHKISLQRSRARRLRPSSPVIEAEGRQSFLTAVSAQTDSIALCVGSTIRELRIIEADPGKHRLIRFVDTVSSGKSESLRLWTDSLSISEEFWRELPAFAASLAKLEQCYMNSGFFPKVVSVAVKTQPLGIALSRSRRQFGFLIRAVPMAFHSAILTVRAAENLQHISAFLEGNFRLPVAPGEIGRYIRLRILAKACVGAQILLGRPRLLRRLDPVLDVAYAAIQGADVEEDLLEQAEDLSDLLTVGHSVMVALAALDIELGQ